jgi:NarL family two-component system response regulator LiaR
MSAQQRKIGVVVVDDHAMTRIGLAFMLKTFDDITMLGEAETGDEALDVCANVQPDVVLMDMLLADQQGPDVIAELRRRQPDIRVVALSSFDDQALVERALQAGAISYVLKNVTAFDLAQAIRRAYAGKATLAPEAVQALVAQMQRPAQPAIEFTERERAVLQLMARGQSNSQIAAQLFVSAATVKGHIGAILGKLGVTTRSEAIARVWAQGLVKPDETPPAA